MRRQKEGATAATMAPNRTVQRKFYRSRLSKSSAINELLANLLFAVQSAHLSTSERTAAMDCIDRLIRLKVDLGLVKGLDHAR
jgi:hypothetical protein